MTPAVNVSTPKRHPADREARWPGGCQLATQRESIVIGGVADVSWCRLERQTHLPRASATGVLTSLLAGAARHSGALPVAAWTPGPEAGARRDDRMAGGVPPCRE